MVQVEMNNMYINIGANNGGEKFEQKTPQKIHFYNRDKVYLLDGTKRIFICNSYQLRLQRINRLTPNDPYMGRTAPLTSKRCILYIY